MYVTEDYYKEEYAGISIEEEQLKRLIKRAERDIDRLTTFRIHDFEKLSERNKKAVRNAVCAQVEFLIENGETASTISSGGGSFSIGAYSEGGRSSTTSSDEVLYSTAVEDFLFPTGLLYSGVARYGY